ncbi:MAG: hypothetical protein HYT87_14565 [Nitrospirae bacterium]|nr:hypothetical protein [Nitrospirota bacterium]
MSTGTIFRNVAGTILALFMVAPAPMAGDFEVESKNIGPKPVPSGPADDAWGSAPETELALLPQNMIAPSLIELTIPSLKVRSLHNETDIAIRLQWPDRTRDSIQDIGRFSDGCAIEFPIGPADPSPFMGHASPGPGQPAGRVHIVHWKATWQDDMDLGFQGVAKIYPNGWWDVYPFLNGAYPFLTEDSLTGRQTMNYSPGTYVGNPVSLMKRKVPVEELIAEGFGTLTTQPRQDASGRGEWKSGAWTVVLIRPLVSKDAMDSVLPFDGESKIAFALWNGSDEDRGARKHYFPWIPLKIQK